METFDDEVAAKSLDFLDRRAKDGKPFFLWHNSTRQHVFIHLKQAAQGQSRAGKEDIYGNGLKEHDGHVGQLLDKLAQTGLDRNTIVIYSTDNGAYQYMWPEGGTSPFRGDKGTTWEGGVRAPFLIRWPGAPGGRVSSDIVDMTDLLPTLAAAAGEPDVVEKLSKGATYGSRNYKVHLDGFDQTALFSRQERQVGARLCLLLRRDRADCDPVQTVQDHVLDEVRRSLGRSADKPRASGDHQPAYGPVRASVGRRQPPVRRAQGLGPDANRRNCRAASFDVQGVSDPATGTQRRCRQDH